MEFEKYNNDLKYPSRSDSDFVERKQAYNNRSVELTNLFKSDLFNELKIQDNPKKELLYSIAWNYGHSYGLKEVYNFAFDMVELIK